MKNILQTSGWAEAYARRIEPENIRTLADMYWAMLLLIAGIAILLGIGYGIWQLLWADSNATFDTTTSAGIVGFNREQLQLIVQAFEKRQAAFEERMSQTE
jgi:hypothetical protein